MRLAGFGANLSTWVTPRPNNQDVQPNQNNIADSIRGEECNELFGRSNRSEYGARANSKMQSTTASPDGSSERHFTRTIVSVRRRENDICSQAQAHRRGETGVRHRSETVAEMLASRENPSVEVLRRSRDLSLDR
jgi:hypothetical protein